MQPLNFAKTNPYVFSKTSFVILFARGGLGNQFFQYVAARQAAPKAIPICIHFGQLESCLSNLNSPKDINLQSLVLRRVFTKLGRLKTTHLAQKYRILGCIAEQRHVVDTSLVYSSGCLPLFAVTDGFFQSESFINIDRIQDYPIRVNLIEKARKWLAMHIDNRETPIFLHIRRGDYVTWPTKSYPAVLPFTWYLHQIRYFLLRNPSAHFVVLSDDWPYVEEFFAGMDFSFSIFRGTSLEDFTLMTQCSGGGIISASTFAWWAAWYGSQIFLNAKYIAPRFWGGWREHRWYPPGIQTSWLEYADVDIK